MKFDSLGKRIKYAREKADMTQEELALKIGKSQSLINHIETDRKRPGEVTLELIARVLNVDLTYLTSEYVSIIPDESFSEDSKSKLKSKEVNYIYVMEKAAEKDLSADKLLRLFNSIDKKDLDSLLNIIEKQKQQGH